MKFSLTLLYKEGEKLSAKMGKNSLDMIYRSDLWPAIPLAVFFA
jgi:hypothetical protein